MQVSVSPKTRRIALTSRGRCEHGRGPNRLWGIAACWALTLACGSGAIQGPRSEGAVTTDTTTTTTQASSSTTTISSRSSSSSSRPTTSTTAATTTTKPADDKYKWTLPVGPRTPSINEDLLYPKIQQGDCDDAQTFLDQNWHSLGSPRTVLLYQAGVLFCAGRNQDARRFFEQADRYGWVGLDFPPIDCLMYQAAASVVRQQPPEDFACPSGRRPPWPPYDPDVPRDDPRTPENESSVTSTTTTTASTTTTTASTTTSTTEATR